ncbi:hypothetical protein THA_1690 [Thermosipho africanus TCF52B]|uniref:Uncharacterized protein n=1 Tax=Thermosipho africanus (strain TCF52B) TaxID=484019 RepID=B7IDQ0_THEAB|nr:hypothetical protein THA_1690 [Thermosipho africanus TCF52B]
MDSAVSSGRLNNKMMLANTINGRIYFDFSLNGTNMKAEIKGMAINKAVIFSPP